MLTIPSFLQRVCQFVKTRTAKATEKINCPSAVLISGATVLAVAAFTSVSFGGNEKNVMAATAEKQQVQSAQITFAALDNVNLTDSRIEGRKVVGNLLVKKVEKEQNDREAAHAEVERIQKVILMEAEEKARKEKEEAARRAEIEARRKAAVVNYSDQDYQVLLRIVQSEAGICDEKGKILVANVILNRVRSGKFPNNITGVVYQPSQFSPVSNGSINTCKVTAQTVDCVNRALAGEDYSEGALYFMNRGGSRSGSIGWFDRKLTFLFKHERHEFFK